MAAAHQVNLIISENTVAQSLDREKVKRVVVVVATNDVDDNDYDGAPRM